MKKIKVEEQNEEKIMDCTNSTVITIRDGESIEGDFVKYFGICLEFEEAQLGREWENSILYYLDENEGNWKQKHFTSSSYGLILFLEIRSITFVISNESRNRWIKDIHGQNFHISFSGFYKINSQGQINSIHQLQSNSNEDKQVEFTQTNIFHNYFSDNHFLKKISDPADFFYFPQNNKLCKIDLKSTLNTSNELAELTERFQINTPPSTYSSITVIN